MITVQLGSGCMNVHGSRTPHSARTRWVLGDVGDPHDRRPFECRAVGVQRWPVDDGVAGSAVPASVTAAPVSEAGDVPDKDLIRT
jgi:hypothetical protein